MTQKCQKWQIRNYQPIRCAFSSSKCTKTRFRPELRPRTPLGELTLVDWGGGHHLPISFPLDLGALVISLPTQVSGYVTPMVPCRGTLQKIFRPSLGATVIASEHHITIIRPVCANCQVNRANGRDNVLFNVSLSVCVHRTSQLAQWTTLLKNVDFGGF